MLNFHADITLLLKRIREIRSRWGQQVPVLIENKSNGLAAIQILRRETRRYLGSQSDQGQGGTSNCSEVSIRRWRCKFFYTWTCLGEKSRGQFTQFPHGKHEDIVDSVVQGLTWLQKLPSYSAQHRASEQDNNLKRPTFGRPKYAGNGYSQ